MIACERCRGSQWYHQPRVALTLAASSGEASNLDQVSEALK